MSRILGVYAPHIEFSKFTTILNTQIQQGWEPEFCRSAFDASILIRNHRLGAFAICPDLSVNEIILNHPIPDLLISAKEARPKLDHCVFAPEGAWGATDVTAISPDCKIITLDTRRNIEYIARQISGNLNPWLKAIPKRRRI